MQHCQRLLASHTPAMQVAEHGFSERVSDKFRKALVARMPAPAVKAKGLNVAELALQAVRDAKAEKERKAEVRTACWVWHVGERTSPRRCILIRVRATCRRLCFANPS